MVNVTRPSNDIDLAQGEIHLPILNHGAKILLQFSPIFFGVTPSWEKTFGFGFFQSFYSPYYFSLFGIKAGALDACALESY